MVKTFAWLYGLGGTAAALVALLVSTPAGGDASGSTALTDPSTAVVIELPAFTGDNDQADLLIEVYASRLSQAGFVPVIGCECVYGPLKAEHAVREELRLDYPAVYPDVFMV